MSELKALQPQVDQLKKLEDELKPHLENLKHEWPLEIMAKIHGMAGEITTAVGQRLNEAMDFPTEEAYNEDKFYAKVDGKPNGVWTRAKAMWLESQGYRVCKTTYTYTNTWDRVPVTAAFYVPDTLQPGEKAPIMWFFHGGGYCIGANDFAPWLSVASLAHARRKKAIIIAPNYPLGPEGNYKDIVESINDFLKFYNEDFCFEKGIDKWTEWLSRQIGIAELSFRCDRVFIEGESAGGLAAAIALFLNADKKTGTQLNISVALLRYPMVEHYARYFKDGEKIDFMNTKYEQGVLLDEVNKILKARDDLEKSGYLPTRVSSAPPRCMPAAFLLSVEQLWKASFQRHHPGQESADALDFIDGLERAQASADKVDHKLLPPIYMYHGNQDTNCDYKKTEEFAKILRDNYPSRYNQKNAVMKIIEGKLHGFDYGLKEEDEPFLQEAYKFIDTHW
ncbi:alpha/beta-hydrolase [Ophiobolus disseminans]|uniref:Alpha/beta-hydrolase n=1 Tax=Ophiobolus disseminans TaxID=1469910 RepID=A0A6A6ZCT6_9PLEO|nr:alpha/beta-hydrolase [Ophiobolus disseminans]